ncbi:MAG TPA: DUF4388 domain-containing protein [Planctomycetota bacterium]
MRVILADSDPASRAGWKTGLGAIGVAAVDIVEAVDAPALLAILSDGAEISLIVASWQLPDLNGFSLLGELRQRRRGAAPPLLAVGEPEDREAMEVATKAGKGSFLVKPADDAEFRKKASRVLFGVEAVEGSKSDSRQMLRDLVSTAEAELELPFFVQLPSDVMEDFLRLAVNGKYPKGATLIKAGKTVKALHVLTLGQAEIQEVGAPPRVLDMGECFGELAFLTEQANTTTVITTGPVEVHSLDRLGLAELVKRHPETSKFLSSLVARRTKVQTRRLARSPGSGMGGSLKSMPFPDLIQMLHSTRKTGVLTIEDGKRKSGIVFDDGNVTHAWSEDAQGVAAFNLIAGWKQGLFYFKAGSKEPQPVTIKDGTLPLLMEAMRLVDESGRGLWP